MKTFKILLTLVFTGTILLKSQAFCGFYVARADAKLFNKSSQVIMVRDGDKTVITMSNDFQGDIRDFAMVIPVPEVLKRENIRIANQLIFDKLDAYSGPRLVEYYDENPCYERMFELYRSKAASAMMNKQEDAAEFSNTNQKYKVQIEASYTVGEYDILILSAKESSGLENWLVDNGYKIPESAKEVLEPYIKSDLKFFVVKVNMQEQKKTGFNNLRPIQIAFNSDKFILPIRLGMANAKDFQDLIVYAFTKTGRLETANYRTVKLPTGNNLPEFINEDFDRFYVDMFSRSWKKEHSKAVFLEYAWDISSTNFVKCDPCTSTPPEYADLRDAGVFWINDNTNSGKWTGANYTGDVFITRMHVRYDRENFPQDLAFQQTPEKQNFQARYVMHHAIKENLTCDKANDYYQKVADRRQKEVVELAALTGWNPSDYNNYVSEFKVKITPEPANNGWIKKDFKNNIGIPFASDNNSNPGNPPNPDYFPIPSISWVLFFVMSSLFLCIFGLWLFKPLALFRSGSV